MRISLWSRPRAGALYGVPLAAAGAAVLAAVCLPGGVVRTMGTGMLLGSVLLFGLPHGSADWWVMRLAAGRRWNLATRVRCVAAYVLAAVGTLGFWRWQPGAALVGFLGLTAWHFGSAEASVLMPERRTFRDAVWWLFAVGRGLLVVFLSLAFRPAETLAVLRPFTTLGSSVAEALDFLVRVAPVLVWTGAVLQTLAIRLDARADPGTAGRRRLTYNVLETCMLLMLFRIAPPLLAFACYFVAFHAWRHVLRLESVVQPEDDGAPWWRLVFDFHRRTLPLTLSSLLGLGLIFWAWPGLAHAAGGTVPYLILLSILTVPHAVVVGWLDKERMKDEG